MLNIDDGISQARKGDIVMSIKESGNTVQIETLRPNINFVKMAMYEAIIELHFTVVKLKNLSYTDVLKKELSEMDGAVPCDALELIQSNCIVMDLKGETREEIIAELVQHLA